MSSATTAPDKNGFQTSAWHFAALIAGNIALALGPWLVRLSDTGPVSAAFWRLLLPVPILAILAWRARSPGPLDRRLALLCMAAGAFFAFDLASWHVGIERTRLANATLFGNSGGVILMIWGLIAARRAPTGQEGAGVLAALIGAAILLGRSLEISAATFVGDLFCLAAGIFYAFYLLPAQRARAVLGPWSVLLLVSLVASPLLLGMALLAGEPIFPGEAGWTPLLTLAVSSQIVGQGLLVFSLRHFPPLIIGMALLTQPAVAALVGWLAFGEMLVPLDILGMALVGAALVLARAPGKVGRVR
ncbi:MULTISPECIES: DMT family transporter [Erythrobacter]|uniref:DMT family transporter n=1 Tax=Erythrobacter aureus TaxID=2182384 RepID=A0A345YD05_9SPHN|nr:MULTISPECIES: DMT family transporter [Erythrobacter]AXK41807.1 DMT family transporter [Erythrobacter aureus]MCF8883622.1 DMT family transporter [Erythrobacter sp. SN021]